MTVGWGSAPDIREGEDEAALKARFVELSARYPERNPAEVGAYVFQDLENPGFRGEDAGIKWARDLTIQERIRQARLNGGSEAQPEVPSKAVIVAELIALARDAKVDAKDRVSAYKTALEAEGHIVKQVDKKVETNKPPSFPQIVFKQADFNVDPESDAA